MPIFAIAIHGGAGTISRAALTSEREAEYHASLEKAVRAGHLILASEGSSLDAVTAAVMVLEDDPLFNAGLGAVFTAEGENELDAAIMDGATLNAGAVAGAKRPRNPVLAARAVMEKTAHVLLAGPGADAFAAAQGLQVVAADYFFTQTRWDALQREAARRLGSNEQPPSEEDKHGTVGAVALDAAGNLAAATSTGGHTHKLPGRIGDTPVIGAGTYADNRACAVSATGDGEYFMRLNAGHEIAARMRFLGESLQQSADYVVLHELARIGGSGGVVAVDRQGAIAMPFNTQGMYRARIGVDGRLEVAIH
jgi:beta-aspartyl-peptidase (threonine type)